MNMHMMMLQFYILSQAYPFQMAVFDCKVLCNA